MINCLLCTLLGIILGIFGICITAHLMTDEEEEMIIFEPDDDDG